MSRRTAVVAALLCLLVAAAGLSTDARDTVVEGRTGLLWVGDPHYAVSSGFAPSVVMPRAKALRMVAALITLLMPGAGPPPTRIASFFA